MTWPSVMLVQFNEFDQCHWLKRSGLIDLMPEYLRHIINALGALDDVEVEILTASHEDGWTLPLSLCHDEDGVIADERLILDEQGHAPSPSCCIWVWRGPQAN